MTSCNRTLLSSRAPLRRDSWRKLLARLSILAVVAIGSAPAAARAQAMLSWKGYDWYVTNGAMAGVAQGDPSNVSVDANGYLHLKITKNGTTWTAGELYSATNLGFGTYQWQVSGPVDRMDPVVVLGLSPYGPAAGVGTDGYDEIDTEFSQWNGEIGHVNMDWGVYPATAAGQHEEDDFFFSLSGGTSTTARMVWSSTSIVSTVMSDFESIGSSANVLNTFTYAPTDPNDEIPQQALPVLLNLWCYEKTPTDGNNVEIILQDFQFVPEGTPIPDASAPADAAALDDASAAAGPDAGMPEPGEAGSVTVDASAPGTGTDSGGAVAVTLDAGESFGTETEGGAADQPPQGGAAGSGGGGCGCRTSRAPLNRGALAGLCALFGCAIRRRTRRASRLRSSLGSGV
jgi:hypothetical protein